ncbi:hypothetical protein L195_g026987 [Trifolium pratense]|uniref:Uncharacterized protein n=1 Tax=Trifolium pratense TaxID=57577 RepID=A0A2K3KXW2_TRIPR|nr:hypothetical protein L195_g026987 [Trifolium pratense]
MASVDKELEEELLEAGNKLLDPPSNDKDLLDILIKPMVYMGIGCTRFVSGNQEWQWNNVISGGKPNICHTAPPFFTNWPWRLLKNLPPQLPWPIFDDTVLECSATYD